MPRNCERVGTATLVVRAGRRTIRPTGEAATVALSRFVQWDEISRAHFPAVAVRPAHSGDRRGLAVLSGCAVGRAQRSIDAAGHRERETHHRPARPAQGQVRRAAHRHHQRAGTRPDVELCGQSLRQGRRARGVAARHRAAASECGDPAKPVRPLCERRRHIARNRNVAALRSSSDRQVEGARHRCRLSAARGPAADGGDRSR